MKLIQISLVFLCGIAVGTFICFVGANKNKHTVAFFDEHPKDFQIEDQVLALALNVPEEDAKSAFRDGERRFIGYAMVRTVIPGVDHEGNCRSIIGTNDYVNSHAQEQINILAHNYAEKYNRQMLLSLNPKP